VPLDPPKWWYGDAARRLSPTLLKPAAYLYGLAARRRLLRLDGYDCGRTVICVGNLTAGGTGKTPLVGAIVEALSARGQRTVILSRGHGGRLTGPVWVDSDAHTADDVGDEPMMLAARAPVLVARRRNEGAARILADMPDISAIVMDDGLQNPQLQKTLTLAVIDGARGLGNGQVIPAGPLRAPLGSQLARTDAVVVNGAAHHPTFDDLLPLLKRRHIPLLNMVLVPDAGQRSWASQRVVAFAGIGNPNRFFQTLERLGARLVATRSYADHWSYTPADAADLLGCAIANDASLVTTEKDAARLRGGSGQLAELGNSARVLRVSAELDPASSKVLSHLLGGALAAAPRL